MNRRNFLNSILVAGASFAILPGAGRVWKAQRVIPPEIEVHPFDPSPLNKSLSDLIRMIEESMIELAKNSGGRAEARRDANGVLRVKLDGHEITFPSVT